MKPSIEKQSTSPQSGTGIDGKDAIYATLDISHKRRAHAVIRDILQRHLAVNPQAKILDVGCADGMVGKLLGDGFDISGVEYLETLAQIASKKYQRVVCADLDAGPLPFKEGSFDIVVAGDVVEHCKHDRAVMRELFRVTRPGGICIISLPNIAQIQYRFRLLLGRFDYENAGVMCDEHLHFYTARSMKRLIEAAGFEVLRLHGSGTLYSYLPIFKTMLSPQIVTEAIHPK
jgi:2-polyprenyl-3-methyl-5-hydroxy-6-metoxy-1,4-benzoquinol methylase